MRPKKNIDPKILKKKIDAVKKLITICGGEQKILAQKMSVTPQAVSFWLDHGVPINRIDDIQKLFEGKILLKEIWPEYFK